jgi:hypothetical protein
MALPSNRGATVLSMLPPRMRRALSLLVAVVLLVVGLYAADIFSGNLEVKTVIAEGKVVVPANSYNCTKYQETEAGKFYFEVKTENNPVKVYINDENSTGHSWNGTETTLSPSFFGTSGVFSVSLVGELTAPITGYLVFSNPEASDMEVSYEVSRHYTYNNYIALTAGIALAAAGAILLGMGLLGGKLREFNRALDEQV